jgi:hypothetical protein
MPKAIIAATICSGDQADDMIEMIRAAFRGDIWLAGEPIAALAVDAVDGERPKPPSPRFPV